MNPYIDLLKRNRNYRLLWFGNVSSQLGDWFNLLASAELITDLSGNNIAVSYLFLARFLPLFLFSPIAGVLADRFNRKYLLVISDVLRAFVVLGFIFIRDVEQLWLLYVLTAVQFCLSALFVPARSAVLANVVDDEDLITANALDSFTWSTMLALGAFLGGIVAAVFGRNVAFFMDALTFAFSAVCIAFVVVTVHQSSTQSSGGWLSFVDGFRYLRERPFILTISLIKAAGSLVWGAVNVFEIAYADTIFPINNQSVVEFLQIEDAGTATLGLIYVFSGIGTGFGPLIFRKRLGDEKPRILLGITIGFWLTAVGILSLGLVNSLTFFLVATLIRTVGTGVLWVFSAVLLQLLVPNNYRGRVFAFEFAALTLAQSISTVMAGVMPDQWGWSLQMATVFMGALGLIVAFIWSSGFWQRTVRRVAS